MKDRIIQLMVRSLMYVREVSNMREAQKEYFHFRNAKNMVDAKMLEQKIDVKGTQLMTDIDKMIIELKIRLM